MEQTKTVHKNEQGQRLGNCIVCNKIIPIIRSTKYCSRKCYDHATKAIKASKFKAYRKHRYDTDPGYVKNCARWTWAGTIKSTYGVTVEDYARLLHSQSFACGICGRSADLETLAVDHCHATGKVRGLLCRNCNWLVASHHSVLRAAADYLIGHDI